jgi:hypothetical protein
MIAAKGRSLDLQLGSSVDPITSGNSSRREVEDGSTSMPFIASRAMRTMPTVLGERLDLQAVVALMSCLLGGLRRRLRD